MNNIRSNGFRTADSRLAMLQVGITTAVILLSFVTRSSADQRLPRSEARDLVQTYCYDCHGDGANEGEFSFDEIIESATAHQHPEHWWKVLKNLRSGVMPPPGESKPSAEEIQIIANWIMFDVFQINADDPDPGRLPVRRLNRTEYGNTIRDLMGISFDSHLKFPADDAGYGFDNVGDALSFSPLLLEKYLTSAREIVSQAVPTESKIVPLHNFQTADFVDEQGHDGKSRINGKQKAKLKREFEIKQEGEYNVDIELVLHGSFDFDPARYSLSFSIDGTRQFKESYGWEERTKIEFQFHQKWKSGEHELVFDVVPIKRDDSKDKRSSESLFAGFEISAVKIDGPGGASKRVQPANYQRFFTRDVPPESLAERREYATEILGKFSVKAFRSHVSDETIARLVDVAEFTYSMPDHSFEAGIARAIIAILSSPRFLFHLESFNDLPDSDADLDHGLVSELALASRLSYFLWSSMPDDQLFQLAHAGQLRDQLPQQIKRMIADERSHELLKNFVGQWLQTRDIMKAEIDPLEIFDLKQEYEGLRDEFVRLRSREGDRDDDDPKSDERKNIEQRFQELRTVRDRYDGNFRRTIQRETEMFVEYLLREDRSLLELIDSDYTFLNEFLAEHYGLPNVEGKEMRRVDLPADSPRGGVLTQASMLMITSNPTRTSPVKRGQFILDNVLGSPAAPAPGVVPDLEDSISRFGEREPTLRELLAAHREAAICSSCHARMDPPGLALENFNALGIWRETEKGQPIEPAGELITGEKFANVKELKQILKQNHARELYRCVTQKMLTYALGRGVEYTDEYSVEVIVNDLEKNGGKFSVLIEGIVNSAPFQRQRLRAVANATDAPE